MFRFLNHRKLFFNIIKNDISIFDKNFIKECNFKPYNNFNMRFFSEKNTNKNDKCNKSSGNNNNNKKGGGEANSKKPYKSIVRHNFSPCCEEAINKQINMELYAFYWYTTLQHHFDRDDIALLGFSKFFEEAAAEELVHGNSLMVFQMKRGGVLQYFPIEAPPICEWTAACALAESIELEKQVTKSLEDLANLASDQKDDHLNDYICGEFLTEQYHAIKDLANLLSRTVRAGPGSGLVIVDGELQKKFKVNKKKDDDKK